jgi:hypothetical protein
MSGAHIATPSGALHRPAPTAHPTRGPGPHTPPQQEPRRQGVPREQGPGALQAWQGVHSGQHVVGAALARRPQVHKHIGGGSGGGGGARARLLLRSPLLSRCPQMLRGGRSPGGALVQGPAGPHPRVGSLRLPRWQARAGPVALPSSSPRHKGRGRVCGASSVAAIGPGWAPWWGWGVGQCQGPVQVPGHGGGPQDEHGLAAVPANAPGGAVQVSHLEPEALNRLPTSGKEDQAATSARAKDGGGTRGG